MKIRLFLSSLIIFSSTFYHFMYAQDTTQHNITFGGSLQTETRFRLNDNNEISWHESRLTLSMESKPNEKTSLYSEIWFRSLGTPNVKTSSNLFNSNDVTSLNIQFREAYVDLYGFLLDNLDLRIGRQRIAWGTADKFNPTDNLNPPDLEDIWDFGRRLGSDAFKATYYYKDMTFSLVYIPLFTPAILPRGDWSSVFFPDIRIPQGLTVNLVSDAMILPQHSIGQSSTMGIKVSKNISGMDFSLSFTYGRDHLPLVKTISIIPATTPGLVNIHSELMYPRVSIVGFDFAGELSEIGVWAEAAIFFPEKVTMTTDYSPLGIGTQTSTVLDDKPYIKYVIGSDYTFLNGLYINAQYVHGLFHERGSRNLEDYFFVSLEWKTLDDKLKIIPFGGGIEIKDLKKIHSFYALVIAPEITYFHTLNTELSLGMRIIDGKDGTVFGQLRSKDEVYAKVKYSF